MELKSKLLRVRLWVHKKLFHRTNIDLGCANLDNLCLGNISLNFSNLSEASMVNSDLSNSDLKYANLENVKLVDANLENTDFYCTNLANSNLTGASLTGANFKSANLTDVKGLPTQEEVLDRLFKKTEEGYIVYKIFGKYYNPNKKQRVKKGYIIQDRVDKDRRNNNSFGINVTNFSQTLKDDFKVGYFQSIWKCLLSFDDLDKVCVPYGTNGNIRCGKIKLLEMVG